MRRLPPSFMMQLRIKADEKPAKRFAAGSETKWSPSSMAARIRIGSRSPPGESVKKSTWRACGRKLPIRSDSFASPTRCTMHERSSPTIRESETLCGGGSKAEKREPSGTSAPSSMSSGPSVQARSSGNSRLSYRRWKGCEWPGRSETCQ